MSPDAGVRDRCHGLHRGARGPGAAERGDEVVALVRNPAKADALRELGCELVEGDLASLDAIKQGVEGADAVIHGGAIYQVGIKASEREGMFDANVRGTARVLDAAIEARIPRIVFISSAVVFGDTRGDVASEDYRRAERDFASYYEETKVLAHEIAEERIARGAPIIVVQPGAVYGPADHSELGTMIEQAATGKLKAKMLSEGGFVLVHVQDIADGILLALDRGEVGEAYILGGDKLTMGELVDKAAGAGRAKAPAHDDAHRHAQGLRPAGPGGRADDGLPAEPGRADPRRPGDLLRRRRQGPPGARLHHAPPRRGAARDDRLAA